MGFAAFDAFDHISIYLRCLLSFYNQHGHQCRWFVKDNVRSLLQKSGTAFYSSLSYPGKFFCG
jgi:hypothetical protein